MDDSGTAGLTQAWIDEKLSNTADQIENRCKNLISKVEECDNLEDLFLEKWKNRQQQRGKVIDSDTLALRIMETLILLSIVQFHLQTDEKDSLQLFKQLEERLMDWSEAVGLIRSLSDERFSLAETSMDIDFDPSADTSQTSSFLNISHTTFDIYLLEKFKGFKRIKEITEIVAERCGIPVDSDFEDEKRFAVLNSKKENQKVKHWRRVKPVTLQVKRVPNASVNRPSSLSVSDLKQNNHRYPSSSSRQVELDFKQPINQNESNRRRHSEASAPQIIQQTTPTKAKKTFNYTSNNNNANSSISTLSDSFVILETPPRALPKQISQNDLTSSVRRLFPQQPMEQ